MLQVNAFALDLNNAGRLHIEAFVQALDGKELSGVAEVIDAIDPVVAAGLDFQIEAVALLFVIGARLEMRRMV